MAVRLRNPYGQRLSGTVTLQVPPGWPAPSRLAFALSPGEQRLDELAARIPEDAAPRDYPAKVVVALAGKRRPPVEKPVVLSVISRDMLGNLMPNGDFETPNANGTVARYGSHDATGATPNARVTGLPTDQNLNGIAICN